MLVATAGHVDHGKTSLVKHLTGTNTDRLAEEKQRGLTIELGYAFSKNTHNEPIAFIDVPGHHGFINTMISGINGIDLGMLVVAADDGPMPQTLEHVQLLKLLGVERFIGVITKCDLVDEGVERFIGVITKCDLVDESQLSRVTRQITDLIPNAPICTVSNHSGAGITQLESTLNQQLNAVPVRQTEAQFRLYIDRVFIKKGAGVVVTGTCLSGSINIGDELKLHASDDGHSQAKSVRVREIHSQGKSATSAHAGQRCALNIAGKVSLDNVHKGDFLCANPSALPSHRLDIRGWTSAGSKRSFKHLGRVKLYIGTRRVQAKTYFLDRGDNAAAGHRIQLILDKPVVAFAGDRFILRDDNESTTLGGGIVIDPQAPQRGKSRSNRLTQLDALEMGQPSSTLAQQLFKDGEVVSLLGCQRTWNLSTQEIHSVLALPPFNAQSIVRASHNGDELLVSVERWQHYIKLIELTLKQWHDAQPMELGIRPELLQTLIAREVPSCLFKDALNDRVRSGRIVRHEQLLRAANHSPAVSRQVQREWQQLVNCMTARGLQLPLRSEIQKDTGFDAKRVETLTRPAIKAGKLFEIGEKRLALPSTLTQLAVLIEQFTLHSGGVSVIQAKEIFGLGRNLTIEILEFFDTIGYTKRSDNIRLIQDFSAVKKIQPQPRPDSTTQ